MFAGGLHRKGGLRNLQVSSGFYLFFVHSGFFVETSLFYLLALFDKELVFLFLFINILQKFTLFDFFFKEQQEVCA
jgi:hypothetical protein